MRCACGEWTDGELVHPVTDEVVCQMCYDDAMDEWHDAKAAEAEAFGSGTCGTCGRTLGTEDYAYEVGSGFKARLLCQACGETEFPHFREVRERMEARQRRLASA